MLWKFSNLVERVFPYRAFSLTWPAAMQIYWNKRRRLHKKRAQIPQDWVGTPTWPPFHCLGHQYGRRDVMWKHSIPMYLAKYEHAGATFFLSVLRAMWSRFASPCEMRARALFCNVWNAKQQETRETTGYPKCLRIVSIKYILHLFSFIFLTEKWEKLNSVPLCYGARDDAYGEFAFSKAGMIMKLTLTHINGFLSCNPMFPASHWGCDHPSLTQGKLMTLVTFENRTRLQPARIFGTPCNPQYSINGSSLNSTSLSFEPFDIPLAAPVDDNFQIWFGQDFTNCSEENNAGVICVDVYALYSWAVSKMYQSPVREKKECACCYCCCYCLWWWWWQRQKKKN